MLVCGTRHQAALLGSRTQYRGYSVMGSLGPPDTVSYIINGPDLASYDELIRLSEDIGLGGGVGTDGVLTGGCSTIEWVSGL